MPIKSKAQQRYMYAAKEGIIKDGITKKAASKMIQDTPKKNLKDLPEKSKDKKSVKKNKA